MILIRQNDTARRGWSVQVRWRALLISLCKCSHVLKLQTVEQCLAQRLA